MDRVKQIPLFSISLIIILGAFFSNSVIADTLQNQPPGIQLACNSSSGPSDVFCGGCVSRGAYVDGQCPCSNCGYCVNQACNNAYWTRWHNVSHGCKKSCLIDRHSGNVIRCRVRGC